MHEFKGRGWFKLNDKLVLMISDEAKDICPIYCKCDIILCSTRVAKKHAEDFRTSGATVISLD